jgi:hypothetical protein
MTLLLLAVTAHRLAGGAPAERPGSIPVGFSEGDIMDRRELLGALGAGAFGMAAISAYADDKSAEHCCELDKTHEDCLKACGDCAKACAMTFHHCLNQLSEGKKEHAKALRLVSDCAEFCGLSACMIAKQSPLMTYSCGACAEACRNTLAEVQRFDAAEMVETAKKLRECETSCRNMVANMRRGGEVRAN